jgi:hypothetical protein
MNKGLSFTKCSGTRCIIKEKCKRYDPLTTEPKISAPFEIDNGLFKCQMFIGEPADLLIVQLKKLMSAKKYT